MSVRTSRWTRSPRGVIFGVVTGLAEWRGLPVDMTRLVVILITVFTAVFPACLIYLLLAVILPEQTERDILSSDEWRRDGYNDTVFSSYSKSKRKAKSYSSTQAEDASFRDKTDEDLEREYEELKKKVETMENDVFDKEKDWDNRFNKD